MAENFFSDRLGNPEIGDLVGLDMEIEGMIKEIADIQKEMLAIDQMIIDLKANSEPEYADEGQRQKQLVFLKERYTWFETRLNDLKGKLGIKTRIYEQRFREVHGHPMTQNKPRKQ